MKGWVVVPAVVLLLVIAGCEHAVPSSQSIGPVETESLTPVSPLPSAAPASPVMERFRPLLEYVPAEWADKHPYEAISPGILLLDIARVSADLGLPPVTGADDRKAKLGLITGLDHQGLLACGGAPDMDWNSGSAFDEWGWDIADVDQVLCDRQSGTAVLLGEFGRAEIGERLSEKGYKRRDAGPFTIYSAEAGKGTIAVKADTWIVSRDKSEVERLIEQKKSNLGLHRHPAVAELLNRLSEDVWGIWIAPSGDAGQFEAYAQGQLAMFSQINKPLADRFREFYKEGDAVEFGWDALAVGFVSGKDKVTTLTFLYHYPSEDESQKDVSLLKRTLSQMPVFSNAGIRLLADLLTLQEVEATGSVLEAEASTRSRSFLGSRFSSMDFWFLPFRVRAPRTFPDWQQVTSAKGEFSVLMPGAPNEYTETIDTGSGNVELHQVVFDGQQRHYEVSYADYRLKLLQAIDLDAAVENFRQVLVVQHGYELLEDSIVSAGEYRGRELKAASTIDEQSGRWRLFVVGNRLYSVTVTAPGTEAFSQEADKFFDSFRVVR